jgi:hypothetical protein
MKRTHAYTTEKFQRLWKNDSTAAKSGLSRVTARRDKVLLRLRVRRERLHEGLGAGDECSLSDPQPFFIPFGIRPDNFLKVSKVAGPDPSR